MNWTEEEYAEYRKRRGIEPEKPKPSKYRNRRTNGYASRHESEVAAQLHTRELGECATVLEQVPFRLFRGRRYIADFVLLLPDGRYEVWDAKGFRTPEYKLKKDALKEVWGVEIREV